MPKKETSNNLPLPPEEIIKDYRLAYQSRQASLIGRREVHERQGQVRHLWRRQGSGPAGDGARLPQRRLAFRLLPRPDLDVRPGGDEHPGIFRPTLRPRRCGARSCHRRPSMNAHFATRYPESDGSWKDQTASYNVSRRCFTDRLADAAPGRAGLCLRTVPRTGRTASSSRNSRTMATRSPGPASATPPPPRACSGSRSTPSACCTPRPSSPSTTTAMASRSPTNSRWSRRISAPC